jgi:hypothetical protein
MTKGLAEIVDMHSMEKESSYGPGIENICPPKTITFPPPMWMNKSVGRTQVLALLSDMGKTFFDGARAVRGLYYDIVRMIRRHEFTDAEVRSALSNYFSEPRICELLRVARAPDNIFLRYEAQQIGFGVALKQARAFRVPKSDGWKKRKLRRSAERLVAMCQESGQKVVSIYVQGFQVEVRPEEGTAIPA